MMQDTASTLLRKMLMRQLPINPVEMFASPWRHRRLVLELTKREIMGRYKGSTIGLLWSFFNPLFMLIVYTFVFSEIFKARWVAQSETKIEFALVLFAGLIIFNLFAECINRAPGTIIANVSYVKKTVFPLELLPLITLLSAIFHCLISLGVWLIAHFLFIGPPHPSAFYFPLILAPFAAFIMGASWALSSIGVFLRDVSQLTSLVTTSLMFLSPIFYPLSSLPEQYRPLLQANPLTPAIELTRSTLYWGEPPAIGTLSVYWALSMLAAWLGFLWFQKTRSGFADVL